MLSVRLRAAFCCLLESLQTLAEILEYLLTCYETETVIVVTDGNEVLPERQLYQVLHIGPDGDGHIIPLTIDSCDADPLCFTQVKMELVLDAPQQVSFCYAIRVLFRQG